MRVFITKFPVSGSPGSRRDRRPFSSHPVERRGPPRHGRVPAFAGVRSVFAALLILQTATAATYFVATDGRDDNPGTIDGPFATIHRTQRSVAPGDTVYIRGGTYRIHSSQIARKRRIWAYVVLLDRNGAPGNRINYFAYQGEKPVFDFSGVKPPGFRVHAFSVPASWVHLKGLEVTGVQVTIRGHTQSICFENNGNHNIYEQLSMHDGQAIGIYSVRGSSNLFLNCDAYNNHDRTSEGGRGGNVDGFGCHPRKGDTGNVFRGCRAWFNSDDGFDCINAAEAVTFENCWAYYSGFSRTFKALGDGNGFKAGGYGSTPAARLPHPIPRHVVRSCLAVRNRANGFYANHHVGGCDWFGNRAYRNGKDFNMLSRLADNVTDVPGYGHNLRNNTSYRGGKAIVNLDAARCRMQGNVLDQDRRLDDRDFRSLDEAQLVLPRQPNGDLPVIDFLQPVDGGRKRSRKTLDSPGGIGTL